MFSGFPKQAQSFFKELKKNNNRPWFAENKERYEALVLQPALEFVAAMERPLKKLSPFFTAVPKKSGGSIMRIYRDTRFSKDKTPYKTNLGIHFRHEAGKNAHAPGFYFHIDAERAFMGGGIWQPDAEVLEPIRFLIDDAPDRWKKIKSKKDFRETFSLEGSSLKRAPKGYPETHPLIEDLKRKDHFFLANFLTAELTSLKLIDHFIAYAKRGMPYMRFLCDAVRLPC